MSDRSECSICLHDYNSAKCVPKFLACFHTYCLHCLQHLHTGGSITCPFCRKETEIENVQDLQTNFYLATLDSALAVALDKVEGAKAADEAWYWCGNCEKIAVTACKNASHERYGLSTTIGREMTESHLKTNQLTCRVQWETSLAKRKEVDKTLTAIGHSLQYLLQEVGTVGKNNKQKIKAIEKNLQELIVPSSEVGKEEKAFEKKLASSFQKYNDLVTLSKADSREITSLSLAFSSLQNALVSLDIQTESKGKIEVPLFCDKKIGFQDDRQGSKDSHALTVLSYLILSNMQEGKILQQQKDDAHLLKKQKAIEAGKGGSKPTPQSNPAKADPSQEAGTGARPKVPPPIKSPAPQKAGEPIKLKGKDKPKDLKPPGPTPKTKPTFMNNQHFNPNPRPNFHQKNLQKFVPNQQQTYSLGVPLTAVPPPMMMTVSSQPSLDLIGKKYFLEISVNGNPYGRIIIELRPDVAPMMCQRFGQACVVKHGTSYQGTMIFKCEAKTFIIGGRTAGTNDHFIADSSPLKRARGAIFLRLKKDIQQTSCPVVSNEFIIQLNDERKDTTWSSTVFGFVTDGLAICDAISHLDPKKDHIAIARSGIV